jgi:hypothetical protein
MHRSDLPGPRNRPDPELTVEPSGLLITFTAGRANIRILGDYTETRRLAPVARWLERMLRGLRMSEAA